MSKYTIGIDFGTESGRVVVVDVKTGDIVSTDVTEYRHGVIDNELPYSKHTLKRDTALQHPQDYIDVLEQSIPKSLSKAQINKNDVIGIGLDFTACTMLPVDENFKPLCFHEKWKNSPHAWVKLWKHHAAQEQADRINELAKLRNEPWLSRYGGIISSEWMLPKVLEILEESPDLYDETAYFLEAADWITTIITGTLKRNSCAAGFKGTWSSEEGFVSKSFLQALHPHLKDIYEDKLSGDIVTIGNKAGHLTEQFAKRMGLVPGIPIAMGMVDAHSGVPGAGVTEPNKMVLVMGTSTCHMLLSDKEKFIDGISGVVKDGIIPNYFAYEAGQAAVGDIFAWFVRECVPAYVKENASKQGINIHRYLEQLASKLPPGSNGLLALDWHNGCRSPLVDANLSGMFVGLTLSTKPEEMYRSLIEATAFGTKMIIEKFIEHGINIEELVACGGLPQRNRLLMQIYADVMGMPIKISNSTVTPAIGSAMYGSVAAGADNGGYDTIQEAAQNMAASYSEVFIPNNLNHKKYQSLYEEYKTLVDYFGRGHNDVMKRLRKMNSI